LKESFAGRPEVAAKFGFWICDLQYPVAAPPPAQEGDPAVNAAFGFVENQCPRFYEPGQKTAARVEGGWVRVYPQSDIRLYVMDDGNVYYKYMRAINPMLLGSVADLRAGRKVDCGNVRGRNGLPWEREI
jgi:hypothetical protein